MMANDEHKLDKAFIGLHLKTGTSDGGACLNRHITRFTENSSCSHRWQAYEKAKEYSQWYNYPAYQELAIKPSSSDFESTQWGQFYSRMKRPAPGGWDLTASTKYTKRTIKNFVKWSKCPYWHNAHHLIPNSVLNNCIAESSEEDLRLYTLIRVSLLEEKYNLNHKENMIILPMCQKVASALGLPRHIAGIEGTADGKHYSRSHPQYSLKVKTEFTKIIMDFAKKIDTEDHESSDAAVGKAKLENLSKSIFDRLRSWQKVAKTGASLDDMP